MAVCVLADTQLFPRCQSPSGGWINEVGLTWSSTGVAKYHSAYVCCDLVLSLFILNLYLVVQNILEIEYILSFIQRFKVSDLVLWLI